MRLETETAVLVKDQTVCIGLPHPGASNIVLVLDGWEGKRARITVEEIVDTCPTCQDSAPMNCSDAHHAKPDYRPCTREFAEAHPEESEYRYRHTESSSWSTWYAMHRNFTWCSYDYEFHSRAPQADEPVAAGTPGAIISWQEAQRRVDVGLEVECSLDSMTWNPVNRITHSCGKLYRYRIPLAESDGCERYAEPRYVTILREQLRTMTGSRDAAVAALEQERSKNKKLERDLRRCFDALRGVKSEANTACGYVEGIVEEIKGKAER